MIEGRNIRGGGKSIRRQDGDPSKAGMQRAPLRAGVSKKRNRTLGNPEGRARMASKMLKGVLLESMKTEYKVKCSRRGTCSQKKKTA